MEDKCNVRETKATTNDFCMAMLLGIWHQTGEQSTPCAHVSYQGPVALSCEGIGALLETNAVFVWLDSVLEIAEGLPVQHSV